jgi:hypothetical protein
MLPKIQMLYDNGALDRAGAIASFACAIHCVALPFAISLLPLLGLSFLADERFDWLLLALAVGAGVLSLLPSYFRHHRKARTLILFVFGFALIFVAHLWLEDDWHIQAPVIITGAGFVISAHIINRKLCQSCIACRAEEKAFEIQ